MEQAITLDEFERQYAERSGVAVEWLHANDRFGAPCDCGEEGCEGWQMIHEAKHIGIGTVSSPPADLRVTGKVCVIEESTYSYGDVVDSLYNSLLTKALLEFEGKHIEVTVRVLDVGDDTEET